jgi:hypothetical protein
VALGKVSPYCTRASVACRISCAWGNVNFTNGKGIVSAGGGMDIRLTRRLVWRVFEFQIGLAGARNGPLLTGGPSTGIAYRFGGAESREVKGLTELRFGSGDSCAECRWRGQRNTRRRKR